MKPPPPFLLLLLLHITTVTTASADSNATKALPPTPAPASSPTSSTVASSNPSALDPQQVKALRSLKLPTRNACSRFKCDSSKPFSHLLSLQLSDCSNGILLSPAALKYLSTIQNLSFLNCPIAPVRFPQDLSLSLHSFSCIRSLRRLSGVFLSRFVNLTDLTIVNVPVNTRGLYVILGNMNKLRSVTISNASIPGYISKHLHSTLTHIDFSGNKLKGNIPTSVSLLENLEHLNLSSNELNGVVPSAIGDMIALKNLSLASNSLSGPIPESMASLPDLVHLDLGSNQLNGTIPKFISQLKKLRYLNLQNNNLHGVLPFNASFIKRLAVLNVGGNSNLCYNNTVLSSKLKLGVAPCDKHGLPMSPPPAMDSSDYSDSSDYNDNNDDSSQKEYHHGPNKVILGLAIGISTIVFLIVFVVLLSKWCG